MGGRLAFFQERWRDLGAPETVLRIIFGARIPLVLRPPLVSNWQDSRFITQVSSQVSQEINSLLEQGVLEHPKDSGPSCISRLFLIRKRNGKMRQICDLGNLNFHVSAKKFHLPSHFRIPDFLQDGDWMTRIDLSQAYLQVPIARSHRCFLRLVYDQKLLQLTCLPFGLSASPHLFATVTNWVAETLRSRGMRVVIYLDDFFLTSQSRARLISQTAEAIELLEFLDWTVNFQKCIQIPTQRIEFLGLVWDTGANQMSLPVDKRRSISDHSGSVTLQQLQSLLGSLNFANFVVHRGCLHCRHLQRFLISFKQGKPREGRSLTPRVLAELKWWSVAVASTSLIHKPPISGYLTTDAADFGWGAQINDLYLLGTWSPEQCQWHSNRKEMFAVLAALRDQGQCLRGSHVLLQMDNTTLVAYSRKEGGTRSINLLDLTFEVLQLVDSLDIILSAAYLPGRYNGIADRFSRGKPVPEWHLREDFMELVYDKWGPCEIDLFASTRSAVVSKYVSRFKRLERRIHRCIQPLLGLQTSLGLPSRQSDSQGSGPSEPLQRPVPSGGSQLASDLLATRSGEQESGAPLDNSRSPQGFDRSDNQQTSPGRGSTQPSDMESWVWKHLVGDWSPHEQQLIESSWRKSTQDTYRAPIRRWLSSCNKFQVDPGSPRGSDLARFLANTFVACGFSHNTMLLHRSAVSTFCSGIVRENISSDFLVRQVLKAVSVAKPRETKSPIWDSQILISWLSTPSEDLSFFEISRRTATLLLVVKQTYSRLDPP